MTSATSQEKRKAKRPAIKGGRCTKCGAVANRDHAQWGCSTRKVRK